MRLGQRAWAEGLGVEKRRIERGDGGCIAMVEILGRRTEVLMVVRGMEGFGRS